MNFSLLIAVLALAAPAGVADPWTNGRTAGSRDFNFTIQSPGADWSWRSVPRDPKHPDEVQLRCVHENPEQAFALRAVRHKGGTMTKAQATQLADALTRGDTDANLSVVPADLGVGVPSFRIDYDTDQGGVKKHTRIYIFDALTRYELVDTAGDLPTFDAFAHTLRLNASYASMIAGGGFIMLEAGCALGSMGVVGGLFFMLWRRRRRARL